MKIATCLHGLSRGSSVQADGAYSEKFSTLLDKIKDSDVFIHCWDEDLKEELKNIFNPQKSIFEKQKSFNEEKEFFSKLNFSCSTRMAQGDLFKTLSFLYSRKKAVELKSKYEQENGFEYDVVLVSRFDVGHHKNGLNKTSHLHFDPNLDMSKMYQAYWDQTNAGASDHWFYSCSKNIDTLSLIYDELFSYLKEESDYNEKCRKGWPISNSEEEFSGELFKNTRSQNLAVYTSGNISLINNHCLYKYHLMQNDMWDNNNSIFLNKQLW